MCRSFLFFSLASNISHRIAGGAFSSVVRPEWPRGLHQLGNTCYLNSLLQVRLATLFLRTVLLIPCQYFYTIKDLRDYIATGNYDVTNTIKDEELKNTLIGGRLITTRELHRSRRCEWTVPAVAIVALTCQISRYSVK